MTECNERGSGCNTSKSAVQDQSDGGGVAVTSAYVHCSQRQLRVRSSSDSHTCAAAAQRLRGTRSWNTYQEPMEVRRTWLAKA